MDVCGERGCVRGIVLNSNKHHLSRGGTSTVEFSADTQALGRVQKIRLRVDVARENARTTWFLDSIMLTHKSGAKVSRTEHGLHESYTFLHRQWFTYDRAT